MSRRAATALRSELALAVRPSTSTQSSRRFLVTAPQHPASSSSFLAARRQSSVRQSTPLSVSPASGRHTRYSDRFFHTSSPRRHGEITRPEPGTGIKVTFLDPKGEPIKTIEGNEGDDLLSLAHEYDVDLEGACEGSVACSTCHVVISPEHYDILPEPDDEENDMLDLAFGLEDTSRLGCQVKLTKELEGMTARLPSATRNMYVDGAKARTH